MLLAFFSLLMLQLCWKFKFFIYSNSYCVKRIEVCRRFRPEKVFYKYIEANKLNTIICTAICFHVHLRCDTRHTHTHTHTRKQICWWCWHIAYCKLFSPFVRRWHECAAIIHIRRNSDRSVWHPPRHFLMSHDALDDTLWWESDGEIRVRCHSTDWIFIFTMKENSTELKTHFKELYAPHFCLVARTTYLHCITLNLPLNTLYGDAVLMILTLFLYGHRSIQL